MSIAKYFSILLLFHLHSCNVWAAQPKNYLNFNLTHLEDLKRIDPRGALSEAKDWYKTLSDVKTSHLPQTERDKVKKNKNDLKEFIDVLNKTITSVSPSTGSSSTATPQAPPNMQGLSKSEQKRLMEEQQRREKAAAEEKLAQEFLRQQMVEKLSEERKKTEATKNKLITTLDTITASFKEKTQNISQVLSDYGWNKLSDRDLTIDTISAGMRSLSYRMETYNYNDDILKDSGANKAFDFCPLQSSMGISELADTDTTGLLGLAKGLATKNIEVLNDVVTKAETTYRRYGFDKDFNIIGANKQRVSENDLILRLYKILIPINAVLNKVIFAQSKIMSFADWQPLTDRQKESCKERYFEVIDSFLKKLDSDMVVQACTTIDNIHKLALFFEFVTKKFDSIFKIFSKESLESDFRAYTNQIDTTIDEKETSDALVHKCLLTFNNRAHVISYISEKINSPFDSRSWDSFLTKHNLTQPAQEYHSESLENFFGSLEPDEEKINFLSMALGYIQDALNKELEKINSDSCRAICLAYLFKQVGIETVDTDNITPAMSLFFNFMLASKRPLFDMTHIEDKRKNDQTIVNLLQELNTKINSIMNPSYTDIRNILAEFGVTLLLNKAAIKNFPFYTSAFNQQGDDLTGWTGYSIFSFLENPSLLHSKPADFVNAISALLVVDGDVQYKNNVSVYISNLINALNTIFISNHTPLEAMSSDRIDFSFSAIKNDFFNIKNKDEIEQFINNKKVLPWSDLTKGQANDFLTKLERFLETEESDDSPIGFIEVEEDRTKFAQIIQKIQNSIIALNKDYLKPLVANVVNTWLREEANEFTLYKRLADAFGTKGLNKLGLLNSLIKNNGLKDRNVNLVKELGLENRYKNKFHTLILLEKLSTLKNDSEHLDLLPSEDVYEPCYKPFIEQANRLLETRSYKELVELCIKFYGHIYPTSLLHKDDYAYLFAGGKIESLVKSLQDEAKTNNAQTGSIKTYEIAKKAYTVYLLSFAQKDTAPTFSEADIKMTDFSTENIPQDKADNIKQAIVMGLNAAKQFRSVEQKAIQTIEEKIQETITGVAKPPASGFLGALGAQPGLKKATDTAPKKTAEQVGSVFDNILNSIKNPNEARVDLLITKIDSSMRSSEIEKIISDFLLTPDLFTISLKSQQDALEKLILNAATENPDLKINAFYERKFFGKKNLFEIYTEMISKIEQIGIVDENKQKACLKALNFVSDDVWQKTVTPIIDLVLTHFKTNSSLTLTERKKYFQDTIFSEAVSNKEIMANIFFYNDKPAIPTPRKWTINMSMTKAKRDAYCAFLKDYAPALEALCVQQFSAAKPVELIKILQKITTKLASFLGDDDSTLAKMKASLDGSGKALLQEDFSTHITHKSIPSLFGKINTSKDATSAALSFFEKLATLENPRAVRTKWNNCIEGLSLDEQEEKASQDLITFFDNERLKISGLANLAKKLNANPNEPQLDLFLYAASNIKDLFGEPPSKNSVAVATKSPKKALITSSSDPAGNNNAANPKFVLKKLFPTNPSSTPAVNAEELRAENLPELFGSTLAQVVKEKSPTDPYSRKLQEIFTRLSNAEIQTLLSGEKTKDMLSIIFTNYPKTKNIVLEEISKKIITAAPNELRKKDPTADASALEIAVASFSAANCSWLLEFLEYQDGQPDCESVSTLLVRLFIELADNPQQKADLDLKTLCQAIFTTNPTLLLKAVDGISPFDIALNQFSYKNLEWVVNIAITNSALPYVENDGEDTMERRAVTRNESPVAIFIASLLRGAQRPQDPDNPDELMSHNKFYKQRLFFDNAEAATARIDFSDVRKNRSDLYKLILTLAQISPIGAIADELESIEMINTVNNTKHKFEQTDAHLTTKSYLQYLFSVLSSTSKNIENEIYAKQLFKPLIEQKILVSDWSNSVVGTSSSSSTAYSKFSTLIQSAESKWKELFDSSAFAEELKKLKDIFAKQPSEFEAAFRAYLDSIASTGGKTKLALLQEPTADGKRQLDLILNNCRDKLVSVVTILQTQGFKWDTQKYEGTPAAAFLVSTAINKDVFSCLQHLPAQVWVLKDGKGSAPYDILSYSQLQSLESTLPSESYKALMADIAARAEAASGGLQSTDYAAAFAKIQAIFSKLNPIPGASTI